ncbi:hypothetical protein H0A70_03945 [Alcaligenaceae bacterium]|nr:hypothetical protein [Alcaligenaceae bacterium]
MEARMNAPRRLNILGIGEPFATRWSLALIFGVLVYVGYRLVNPVIVRQFEFSTQFSYNIPVYYGSAALLMLSLFGIHKLLCFPDIRFVGDILKWTHLSRQISSGFKLNPLLLLQPNGAAPMRPGWKDFRPGQSD